MLLSYADNRMHTSLGITNLPLLYFDYVCAHITEQSTCFRASNIEGEIQYSEPVQ
jgi:hypothetical protein